MALTNQQHLLYLQVTLERLDGGIYCLVVELREFVQTIQEGHHVTRQTLQLVGEILRVQVFDRWIDDMRRGLSTLAFQSSLQCRVHERLARLSFDFAWEEVGGVLAE